jgi:hypothetical protein
LRFEVNPGQKVNKTISKISRTWWYMPANPATQDMEVGRLRFEAGIDKSMRLKKKKAQVIQRLPGKHKVLCSFPSSAKTR